MALYVGGTAIGATATEINNALDGMAQGDIVYASDADTPAQLTKGTDDYVLTMNGNVPNWEAAGGANFDTAITINDSGNDVDFRVEGVGAANALFVQGSDGNVGIGNSSPDVALEIGEPNTGGSDTVIQISSGGTDSESRINLYGYATDNTGGHYIKSNTGINYTTLEIGRQWGGDTPVINLDNSGNVGIGVTPESWASGFTALQIGGQASFDQPTSFSAGTEVGWNSNAYYDTTNDRWEAIGADQASRICMFDGNIQFKTGGSSAYSADDAITWTNQVAIASNGTTHFSNPHSTHLCEFQNSHASPYGNYMVFSAASPDNTSVFFWRFNDSSGTEAYIYSDGSYSQVSDRRRKKNIVDADDALVKVNQLSVKNYIRKNDESQKLHIGLIAQDVQEIYPHLITEADDDMKSLTMYKTGLIPILIKAVQELSAKVEALENE